MWWLGLKYWEAPPVGYLEVNIDAGCGHDGKVFWGLVIRDHNANVVAAVSKNSVLVVAEVLGFRWGLQVAAERNLSKVIFELDAQVVLNCFHGLYALASITPFIRDCQDLYANMADVSVVFINRCCNEVAHEIC